MAIKLVEEDLGSGLGERSKVSSSAERDEGKEEEVLVLRL